MSRIEIQKEFHFHAGHRLMRHKGLCASLHGHTYKVQVVVTGPRTLADYGDSGMVVDFSVLKDLYRAHVHEYLDHSTMLERGDPLIAAIHHAASTDLTLVKSQKLVVLPFAPTAEMLSACMYHNFHQHLPPELDLVSVTVYETPTSYARCTEVPEGMPREFHFRRSA